MPDLNTRAADINEILKANRVPLTARPGKRAIRWFRLYVGGGGAGYGIAKGEATNVLRYYDLAHLTA